MANGNEASKATIYFIIGFLVLITAGVIVAGVYSGSGTSGTASSTFTGVTSSPVTATDWSEGNADAPITLLEYGDFECPACGAYYPVVKQLQTDFGDQLRLVFRNFPLYQVHPDAGIAAQAAEAAGLQGKYWDMFNMLYENQTKWSVVAPSAVVTQYFDGYAQTLGLNVAKFDSDINSSVVTDKIAADVKSGTATNINETPTFFINQKEIQNPGSYAEFKADINSVLSETTSTPVSVATSPTSSPITVTSTPINY